MELYQPTTLSVEQCKDLLKIVAKMMCVRTELISTRLLSKDDKKDMLEGNLPIESLLAHVKVWRDTGLRDYANGSYSRYKPSSDLPMQRYRGYGER